MKQVGTLLLLALLSLPSQLRAAQSSFDIDLKELDREKPAVSPKSEKKKTPKTKKATPAAASSKSGKAGKPAADNADYVRYTVKPGDHLFKILVARFGMSNEAAERLIPEIIRLNHITDKKNLTVGRTLLIPGSNRKERVARSAKKEKTRIKKEDGSEAAAMLAEAARLEAQGAGSRKVEAPAVQVVPPRAPEIVPSAPAPAVPVAEAPAVAAPTATAPTATAPTATAPTAAAPIVAAPAAPPANTWICSVTEKDPARIVDAIMNALSLPWSRNRIIQSDAGAPNTFSIMMDRYFEFKGARYIVSIGESDSYSYTLIRLLEGAGYRVLRIGTGDNFKTVSEKLFRLMGLVPDFGKHALQGGRESTGFLVQEDDAGGRRVVITSEVVDPKLKWTLPAGCGAR